MADEATREQRYRVGTHVYVGKPGQVLAKDTSSDPTCVTYVLHNEDHTLGNSLRWMLMKDPQVEFCGYTVPHPTDQKINLRIQTSGTDWAGLICAALTQAAEDTTAENALRTALENTLCLCDHVIDTFDAQLAAFDAKKQ